MPCCNLSRMYICSTLQFNSKWQLSFSWEGSDINGLKYKYVCIYSRKLKHSIDCLVLFLFSHLGRSYIFFLAASFKINLLSIKIIYFLCSLSWNLLLTTLMFISVMSSDRCVLDCKTDKREDVLLMVRDGLNFPPIKYFLTVWTDLCASDVLFNDPKI